MANQNEPIPSCRVKLFLVPPGGGDTIPLGLVEDFSAENTYDSENPKVIGEPIPPDNWVNFGQGRIRWTKVHQLNDEQMAVIAPRVAEFTSFQSYDLLALDPKDSKPIKLAVGCLPASLQFMARGGVAPRDNYDGICRIVLHGQEIQQALSQAA